METEEKEMSAELGVADVVPKCYCEESNIRRKVTFTRKVIVRLCSALYPYIFPKEKKIDHPMLKNA